MKSLLSLLVMIEMESDRQLIDIATCGLTIGQVEDRAIAYMREHPDYEVFLDGDSLSIVARRRM